jgi:tRNA-dihydrouridine synthase
MEAHMRGLRAYVTAVVVASVAMACNPETRLTKTWKDPGVTNVKFNRVVAVCMCKEDALRRSVEDEMVKRIRSAVASYTILPTGEGRTPEQVRQLFQARGFDGAVVARLVEDDPGTSGAAGTPHTPPPSYGAMWGSTGYWSFGWGTVHSPSYLTRDRVVTMDTNVYSVADGKLLWASRSATYNPADVPRLVDEIATATAAEMRKQKLIE